MATQEALRGEPLLTAVSEAMVVMHERYHSSRARDGEELDDGRGPPGVCARWRLHRRREDNDRTATEDDRGGQLQRVSGGDAAQVHSDGRGTRGPTGTRIHLKPTRRPRSGDRDFLDRAPSGRSSTTEEARRAACRLCYLVIAPAKLYAGVSTYAMGLLLDGGVRCAEKASGSGRRSPRRGVQRAAGPSAWSAGRRALLRLPRAIDQRQLGEVCTTTNVGLGLAQHLIEGSSDRVIQSAGGVDVNRPGRFRRRVH